MKWETIPVGAAVLLAGAARLLGSEEPSPPPWEAAALAATPSAILEAARALPEGDGADPQTLFEGWTQRFGDDGSSELRRHAVYLCRTEAGARAASVVHAVWAPWLGERPELHARVIAPDGTERRLDPASIAEAPLGRLAADVFSDRRVAQAPLPGVRAGCVVELESVISERRPFFSRGVVSRYELYGSASHKKRILLDFPVSLPVRYEVQGMRLEPEVTSLGDRTMVLFEVDSTPTLESFEVLTPPEVTQAPLLTVTTGRSWQEVAAGYEAIVEDALSDMAAVRPVIEDVTGLGTSREEVLAGLVDRLQALVRFTGVEFGDAEIVPRTPRETLARQYGDCKDQSVLLVAMLREADIDARVALVAAGAGQDPVDGMPALNAFDHAIVFVPGESPRWIDPTVPHLPVGEVAARIQGKLALVVDRRTESLERVPRSRAGDNRYRRVTRIILAERGAARLVQSVEPTGCFAQESRQSFVAVDSSETRRQWEESVKRNYAAGSLDRLECSGLEDRSAPCRIEWEVTGAAEVGVTESDVAVARFSPSGIFQRLWVPFWLETERRHPLFLDPPHINEHVFEIVPPPGLEARSLPDGRASSFGPLQLTREFSELDDGTVIARFAVDTGDGRLAPEDANALREEVSSLFGGASGWTVSIEFSDPAADALAAGSVREALSKYLKVIEAHPQCSAAHARLAEAFLAAGLGAAARKHARRAVELDPESDRAHLSLGTALTHDVFGRPWAGDFCYEEAERELRRAVELDPKSVEARWNLALFLERDGDGNRYGPDARLSEALAEYRKIREESGEDDATIDCQATALLFA